MNKEKRSLILKTASKRFSKHGLYKTTLDEVARDLRIGKGALYHYFTSKEELFYSTIEYEIELYFDEIKNNFSNSSENISNSIYNYYLLKIDLSSKYKLLFNLIINNFSEDKNEKEETIFNKFLQEEIKILKNSLIKCYSPKREEISISLPNFFVIDSFNLLLNLKVQQIDISKNSYLEVLKFNINNLLS